MWIKKSEYEKLIEENGRLKIQLQPKKIMEETHLDVMEEVKRLRKENLILTGERDFYKNKFAELKETYHINDYDGYGSTSFWVKEKEKPHRCRVCDFKIWINADKHPQHCEGCGRYMTHVQIINDEIEI